MTTRTMKKEKMIMMTTSGVKTSLGRTTKILTPRSDPAAHAVAEDVADAAVPAAVGVAAATAEETHKAAVTEATDGEADLHQKHRPLTATSARIRGAGPSGNRRYGRGRCSLPISCRAPSKLFAFTATFLERPLLR